MTFKQRQQVLCKAAKPVLFCKLVLSGSRGGGAANNNSSSENKIAGKSLAQKVCTNQVGSVILQCFFWGGGDITIRRDFANNWRYYPSRIFSVKSGAVKNLKFFTAQFGCLGKYESASCSAFTQNIIYCKQYSKHYRICTPYCVQYTSVQYSTKQVEGTLCSFGPKNIFLSLLSRNLG